MPEIFSACDIYLSSAEDGLLSMSFAEAMACGLPVLLREDKEKHVYDMFRDGVNGFAYKNEAAVLQYPVKAVTILHKYFTANVVHISKTCSRRDRQRFPREGRPDAYAANGLEEYIASAANANSPEVLHPGVVFACFQWLVGHAAQAVGLPPSIAVVSGRIEPSAGGVECQVPEGAYLRGIDSPYPGAIIDKQSVVGGQVNLVICTGDVPNLGISQDAVLIRKKIHLPVSKALCMSPDSCKQQTER